MAPSIPRPGTPSPSVVIDEMLVHQLLSDQRPDLAHFSISLGSHGWDNEMYRLGDGLAVRLPRRELAEALITNEQRWLPVLSEGLPIPIPVPIHNGTATDYYPYNWTIVPWFEGSMPIAGLPNDQASRLGAFLRVLHRPAPSDAPRNPFRGVPLAERSADLCQRVAQLFEQDHGLTISQGTAVGCVG